MTAKRPLLNYFGGKWRIAPWVISHIPDHKIYCEPFGGSLSILLRKQRSQREIVNDIDAELVNLYIQARDNGIELQRRLKMTPHSRWEYRASMIKAPADPIEQARRTMVRCYFGIGDSFLHNHNAFRTSKTSNTCVAKSWTNLAEVFDSVVDRLQSVTIEQLSYEKMFEKYDSKATVWYLDPPYVLSSRTRKHSYRDEFTANDHMVFIGLVKHLKGHVVLSGYNSDIYESEFGGWKKIERDSNCQGGKVRTEVLWIK